MMASGLTLKPGITTSSTAKNTTATSARLIELRQFGGLSKRLALAPPRPPEPLDLFSAAVGLRPVRPRDSIIPAALPRCFVRRRFVWAMDLAYRRVLPEGRFQRA